MPTDADLNVWRTRAAIETLEQIDLELRALMRSSQPPEAKARIGTMRRLGFEVVDLLRRRLQQTAPECIEP
jgi:hypothetical protein